MFRIATLIAVLFLSIPVFAQNEDAYTTDLLRQSADALLTKTKWHGTTPVIILKQGGAGLGFYYSIGTVTTKEVVDGITKTYVTHISCFTNDTTKNPESIMSLFPLSDMALGLIQKTCKIALAHDPKVAINPDDNTNKEKFMVTVVQSGAGNKGILKPQNSEPCTAYLNTFPSITGTGDMGVSFRDPFLFTCKILPVFSKYENDNQVKNLLDMANKAAAEKKSILGK